MSTSSASVSISEEELTSDQRVFVDDLLAWMESSTAVRACTQISIDRATALRFLRGTKWRPLKAKTKLEKLCALYDRLGDCSLERVAPFLACGAQILRLGAVDRKGRQILYVIVEVVDVQRDTTTSDRARAAMYLYNRILEDRQFQENGVIVVLDLKGAAYSMNRKAQKETDEVLQTLPCRFGGAFIVHPPWWFAAVFKVLKMITSSRLIERVNVISDASELEPHIDKSALLTRLGGTLEIDPRQWLLDEFAHKKLTPPKWLVDGAAPPPAEPEF